MANKKQTMNEGSTAQQPMTGGGGNTTTTQGNSPNESMPRSTTSGGPTSRPTTSGMAATGSSGGGGGGSAAGAAVARSIYDQAKETAGQAYEVAAEKATTKLEEQKSNISDGLASIAGSVRQVSDNLRGPDVQDGISKVAAEYSQTAAQKIENVANYFEKKNVREMYGDLQSFARRNPAAFVGGAFVLGVLAARFLKSGGRSMNRDTGARDGN